MVAAMARSGIILRPDPGHASTSTMHAIAAARAQPTGAAPSRRADGHGVYAPNTRTPRWKGRAVARIGRTNVRKMASTRIRMLPDAADGDHDGSGKGLTPFCIVSTVGTTSVRASIRRRDQESPNRRAVHHVTRLRRAHDLAENRWMLEGAKESIRWCEPAQMLFTR